ncbi:UDP-glucuronic acid decarboxylase 1 [Chytridiales sp. JEL 0842]|nr:UDP-glucuronic acid decarboxylase 1 [Chytridiales sp. JEL 0842]
MTLGSSTLPIPSSMEEGLETIESIMRDVTIQPPPILRDYEPVTHVGSEEFDTTIPLELLRELYLGKYITRNTDSASDDKFFVYDPHKKAFPPVAKLKAADKKRILVTGGAGFVGSHLVDRLMVMGHEVIVIDNFFTGHKRNIQHWIGHPHFELIRHDVVEIYGDPEEHPQKETYWGHVNPIGPRACYDEGKRVAETLTYAYAKRDKVDVRVARIFNTFGPRMNAEDGRVVSNFIVQALKGEDLTVYGDGVQTRSFQYIHDLIDGLIQLMNSNYSEPVNLGNPEEYTIQEFAEMIRLIVNPQAQIINLPAITDDPQRRKPDITRAKNFLQWEPRFNVRQGIEETVDYFQLLVNEL